MINLYLPCLIARDFVFKGLSAASSAFVLYLFENMLVVKDLILEILLSVSIKEFSV
jgi:hypothetical protein